jgi:hypothetical protein
MNNGLVLLAAWAQLLLLLAALFFLASRHRHD